MKKEIPEKFHDSWIGATKTLCQIMFFFSWWLRANIWDLNDVFAGDTLSEEEVMMLINAADKDGDGTLDFEEFVRIMMDWLSFSFYQFFVFIILLSLSY